MTVIRQTIGKAVIFLCFFVYLYQAQLFCIAEQYRLCVGR